MTRLETHPQITASLTSVTRSAAVPLRRVKLARVIQIRMFVGRKMHARAANKRHCRRLTFCISTVHPRKVRVG